MIDIFVKGGWIMYPLFFSSILALTVALERFWYLRKRKILIPEIISVLDQIKSPGDLHLTKSICDKFKGPFSRIVQTSINNEDLPADELRVLVEDEGRQEVRVLQRGLVTLETIATIAPLMGLLGTVLGMIKVFKVIETLGVGQAKALSGGISEALITTATGLIIGIPVFIAYNYFNHRADAFILDMEKYVILLLNKLIRFRQKEGQEEIQDINLRAK
ncbi:MAG: MotA/TolQ/ExbB proton channel family protein [Calditrichae bacterium]|jgi:biopolymer transport protein ExbB|nr:MotA/TolQ/ExbB proton channel family protein [Calditrichia bacterium]NOQ96800.1 MotA/TolQ/ExbB proton channel family protein [Calditrichia bacterium]